MSAEERMNEADVAIAKRSIAEPRTTKRRYREYLWVSLVVSIKCPDRNVSSEGFPGEKFAFFIEDGFFCIESKKNGMIVETAPANVREARRYPPEAS